jgi:hypothetical protein
MAPDRPHARSPGPPLLRNRSWDLAATVDDDLPELECAVRAMAEALPEEDQHGQDTSSEGAPSEEELPS